MPKAMRRLVIWTEHDTTGMMIMLRTLLLTKRAVNSNPYENMYFESSIEISLKTFWNVKYSLSSVSYKNKHWLYFDYFKAVSSYKKISLLRFGHVNFCGLSSSSSLHVLMVAEPWGTTLRIQSIGTTSLNYSLKQSFILIVGMSERGTSPPPPPKGTGYAAPESM